MVNIPPPRRSESIKIGDYVVKAGIYTNPGVVTNVAEDGTVTVSTEKADIAKYHKHTNTSGLTEQEKIDFNAIMDEIMKKESNVDRINELQTTLDSLKNDPTKKKIVETLRNEQAQLIRIARELPKIYTFDGDKQKI